MIACLAKRPRYLLHFKSTSALGLNQVERLFGLLSPRAIKHDSFNSVILFVKTIEAFFRQYNTPTTLFHLGRSGGPDLR